MEVAKYFVVLSFQNPRFLRYPNHSVRYQNLHSIPSCPKLHFPLHEQSVDCGWNLILALLLCQELCGHKSTARLYLPISVMKSYLWIGCFTWNFNRILRFAEVNSRDLWRLSRQLCEEQIVHSSLCKKHQLLSQTRA